MRAVGLAMLTAAVLAVPADAGVYGSNTGAFTNDGSYGLTIDGLATFQMLHQLTVPSGVTIAHPGQVNFQTAAGGDFLGLGTYKGQGPGQDPTCSSNYGTGWTVYADGRVLGVYFCQPFQVLSGNAQSQSLIIQRAAGSGSCPGDPGPPGWIVEWQLVELECFSNLRFSSTQWVSAGAENVGGTTGMAIGLSYVQLQFRQSGHTYEYWPSRYVQSDPGYTITYTGTPAKPGVLIAP